MREKRVRPETVRGIHLLYRLEQVLTLRLPVRRQLADEHGGNNCVLVTHACAGEVAVGLFEAEEEIGASAFFFEKRNLLADVFETR